jgi:hypothetical protein
MNCIILVLVQLYTASVMTGYDGTKGFQMYKQTKFGGSSDKSMLVTSIVPLSLVNDTSYKNVWQNPVYSSTRYCRPIRIQYIKETITII